MAHRSNDDLLRDIVRWQRASVLLVFLLLFSDTSRVAAQHQTSAKISDAFAKAELLGLKTVETEDFGRDSLTATPSQAALDTADSEVVTVQELLISLRMQMIYGDKWANHRSIELLRDFPTTIRMLNGVSSRINTCLWAEEDALHDRSVKIPKSCGDNSIYIAPTKEEQAAIAKEAEVAKSSDVRPKP